MDLEAAIDSGCQPLSFYGNSTKWQGNKTNWIFGAATCNVKLDICGHVRQNRDNVGGWRKLTYFVKWRYEERLQVMVKLDQLNCSSCSLLVLIFRLLLLLDRVLCVCLKLVNVCCAWRCSCYCLPVYFNCSPPWPNSSFDRIQQPHNPKRDSGVSENGWIDGWIQWSPHLHFNQAF